VSEAEFIGTSDAVSTLLRQVDLVAGTDAKVLIVGEAGTGKEAVARMIHTRSKRGEYPLTSVNCAGIPEALLEEELFGRRKGLRVGGEHRDKVGLVERSHLGTIYLEDIDELTLRLQSVFLRFIETGEYEMVGRVSETRKADVRIITSTGRDLREMIKQGTFREDLYYRLNVVEVRVASVRDRREDIPAVLQFFWDHFRRSHSLSASNLSVTRDAMQALTSYDWPGNMREIRNLVERFVMQSRDGRVSLEQLPPEIRSSSRSPIPSDFEIRFSPDFTAAEVKALLTALADYYRSCGGLGLAMTFETEQVVVDERVSA
jgi:transcriptional regulator with PAS, ATPase and Fis domain